MGTDIHGPFVMYKNPYAGLEGTDEWWDLCKFETDRNYDLFHLLAGVRPREGRLPPIVEPRGLPPKMEGTWWREHHDSSPGDCHHESWLTLEEVVIAAIRYEAKYARKSADLLMWATTMKVAFDLADRKELILGFCFDN